MSDKWKDKRIISRETLRELPKEMFHKYPDPKRAPRPGNPNDEEPYIPHSPGS